MESDFKKLRTTFQHKNMVRSIFFSLLLLLTLISCQVGGSNGEILKIENEIKIQLGSTLVFELDSLTKPESRCVELFEDFLFLLNSNTQSIYKYALGSRDFMVIPTDSEGPNSIGEVNGFKILSDSTLLITARGFVGFAVIDFDGKIIEKISVRRSRSGRLPIPMNQTYFRNQVVSEGSGYYSGHPISGNWTKFSQNQLNETSIEDWYDLRNDSSYSLPIYYPDDYLDNGKQDFYHSRIKIDDQLIYSFAYSHDVTSYKVNDGIVEDKTVYEIGLSGLGKFEGAPPPNGIEEAIARGLKKPTYRSLYFDKERNRIYRVGHLAETDEIMKDEKLFFAFKESLETFYCPI